MRNLRKLTSTVLIIALVLTSMTAVFAADSATLANTDKAATLKDLGLYSGTDPTDPKVGLENGLTTQDSLIFLAKLFGYYETATKLTADEVAGALAKFDDASSISDYAKNVVAYSAISRSLNGMTTDGDKFFVGAKDTVTAARFATFMLKQMGYVVADFRESVASISEVKGSKVAATLTGDLTRDAAVGMMFGALTAEKASGKTVISDIVGDHANLRAMAEKNGLIQPETKTYEDTGTKGKSSSNVSIELSVVSVEALNNKQLEIKFNLPMDKNSAQDQTNYEIIDNSEKTLTDNSCKLGDDLMTVTITLDSAVEDCLTNSSKGIVVVSKDIIAANGKKLDTDKEFELEVQDGLLPTVKGVKATGEKNIEITFSEPVYETNNITKSLNNQNFSVKSGTYYYYVQEAELNLDIINLEVGTKLIEGPVTVTVNNAGLDGNAIQDYAGYKVFKGNHTFNYVKDTSAPIVTVTSADKNEVVLKFSKPVKASNIKLYHSEKGNEECKAEATTAGDYLAEITFTFDELLPLGTLELFLVNSETNGDKIIDSYGILVPDRYLTCEVKDTSAPVITAGAVNRTSDTDGTVKFTSNEAGSYYYSIVDDGALEPTVDTSGVGTDCTTAETTITNPTGLATGSKDIYIKVKDAVGNVSSSMKIDIAEYIPPDTAAPVVTNCEIIQYTFILIEFDEELDEAVANDPNSYSISRLSDSQEISFSVLVNDSKTSVKLQFTEELANTDYKLLIKIYKDIYGNTASDYEYNFTWDYINPEVM